MSVSILEALAGAEHNLRAGSMGFQMQIGREQLHNCLVLLEKGYSVDTEIEPLLDEHGDVDNVPDIS